MLYLESHLVIDRCPHCRVANPNITRQTKFVTDAFDKSNQRFWAIYICQRCGGVITASAYDDDGEVEEMYPYEIEIENVIPEKAKAFLTQARDSIHAPSGAIMLAASAIDAMLKEKGYKKGNLYPRINKATEDHVITEDMAKWAHEVRLGANEERHADEDAKLPDSNDAKKTVHFALALAEILFVLPSKVQRGIKEAKETDETTE